MERQRNLALFKGKEQALRTVIGPSPTLLDRREASLLEARIGLSSIIHLRRAGGALLGCGIGWHGPLPYVLVADFPRVCRRTPPFSPPRRRRSSRRSPRTAWYATKTGRKPLAQR
jgi:hypothetical protein